MHHKQHSCSIVAEGRAPLRIAKAGVVHGMRRKQVEEPRRLPPRLRRQVCRLQTQMAHLDS